MANFSKFIFENFMSLGHVELDFDEHNIISIAGFNDTGKSAITRGTEVLFYNAYSTEQSKFIKDGEDFFRITAIDVDGFKVVREKHLDGHSLWELIDPNDKVLYTNSTGNASGKGTYAVSDVPEPIAQFLGVIQDEHTNEKLNVRRNIDRLFLINTTGGDNYKILNSVLRSDILAEASKRINEDRNKLQSNLGGLNAQAETLRGEVVLIDVAPVHIINGLDESIEKLTLSREQSQYMSFIVEQKDILDSIYVHDELPQIDTSRYSDLSIIVNLHNELDEIIQPELPQVDLERYSALSEITRLRGLLDDFIIPETTNISTERYQDLIEIVNLYNELYNINNALSTTDKELHDVTIQLNHLAQTYGIKICGNCGSAVV